MKPPIGGSGRGWRWTREKIGPPPSRFVSAISSTPFGLHAYSHCNTLSGAAMTYAVTGEREYLDTITNAYDWFERTQFYATGGYGPNESLVPPDGALGTRLEMIASSFETPCGSWAGFNDDFTDPAAVHTFSHLSS